MDAAENRLWIMDIGHFIRFHDGGFDEALSNGMRPILFGGESGDTVAFDEESFQF